MLSFFFVILSLLPFPSPSLKYQPSVLLLFTAWSCFHMAHPAFVFLVCSSCISSSFSCQLSCAYCLLSALSCAHAFIVVKWATTGTELGNVYNKIYNRRPNYANCLCTLAGKGVSPHGISSWDIFFT